MWKGEMGGGNHGHTFYLTPLLIMNSLCNFTVVCMSSSCLPFYGFSVYFVLKEGGGGSSVNIPEFNIRMQCKCLLCLVGKYAL